MPLSTSSKRRRPRRKKPDHFSSYADFHRTNLAHVSDEIYYFLAVVLVVFAFFAPWVGLIAALLSWYFVQRWMGVAVVFLTLVAGFSVGQSFHDYMAGTAKIQVESHLTSWNPEWINLHPTYRCHCEYRGVDSSGFSGFQSFCNTFYNGSLYVFFSIMGPMKGSYEGPYPSKKEVRDQIEFDGVVVRLPSGDLNKLKRSFMFTAGSVSFKMNVFIVKDIAAHHLRYDNEKDGRREIILTILDGGIVAVTGKMQKGKYPSTYPVTILDLDEGEVLFRYWDNRELKRDPMEFYPGIRERTG